MPDVPDLGSRWYTDLGVRLVVITTAILDGGNEPIVVYCACGSREPNRAMPLSVWQATITESAEKRREPSSPATHVGVTMSVEAKKKRVVKLEEAVSRMEQDLRVNKENLKAAKAELKEEEKKEKAAQKAQSKKPATVDANGNWGGP
jgi:hypothetical protein